MLKKMTALLAAAVLAAALVPVAAFAAVPAADLAAGSVAAESTQVDPQASTKAKAKKLAKKTKKMRSRYRAVLAKARSGQGAFHKTYSRAYSTRNWYVSYTMHDIDKNGTPELLVNAGTCAADTMWYAYTVKSGKMKFLGRFGNGYTSVYSGSGRALYGAGFHMGVAQVFRGTVSGRTLNSSRVVLDTAELSGFPSMRSYMKSHKLKILKTSSGYDYSKINRAKVKK